MTENDRHIVQACVDETCEKLGVPNHGTGFRCRARHDNGGHGLWVRVSPYADPESFREQLSELLYLKGLDVDVWLNGTNRYCRIDWTDNVDEKEADNDANQS